MRIIHHFSVAMLVVLTSCSRSSPPPADANARYSVVLLAFDVQWKIRGIKAIREETGLGLADAKQLIESSPGLVKSHLSYSEAEAVAVRLRAEKITVEVRKE